MKKIGKNTKLYLIGMIIGGITLGITTVIADTIINSTSVAYKTTTVKAALDELYDIADFKQEVKDMLYPLGSIYISVSGTNPSQLFGGTWVSFGMGRTLLGVGTVEANDNDHNGNVSDGEKVISRVEAKGGEYAHTLSINEMPNHSHRTTIGYARAYSNEKGFGLVKGTSNGFVDRVAIISPNYNYELPVGSVGGSVEHNNVQPYISVYMWKRIS